MSYGQRVPATTASTAPRRGLFRRLLEVVGYTPPVVEERSRDRQPWGKGTGRASYAVVQRRRRANRVAARSRRINRASR